MKDMHATVIVENDKMKADEINAMKLAESRLTFCGESQNHKVAITNMMHKPDLL